MALPGNNASPHLWLWVASFQIFSAKLKEKWSSVLCINMLITSQCENRNAEEKHLALNLENVMSTTEPICKLLIWLHSAPHTRKVHITFVSSPACSLVLWRMLETVSQWALCSSLLSQPPFPEHKAAWLACCKCRCFSALDGRRNTTAGNQNRNNPVRRCLKIKFLSWSRT